MIYPRIQTSYKIVTYNGRYSIISHFGNKTPLIYPWINLNCENDISYFINYLYKWTEVKLLLITITQMSEYAFLTKNIDLIKNHIIYF